MRFPSQKDLAQCLGCHPAEISRYEQGRPPSIVRAFEIAILLGKSVENIFCGAEQAAAERLAQYAQRSKPGQSMEEKSNREEEAAEVTITSADTIG